MSCEEMRDGHEADARISVNLPFERYDEFVVELAVDGARPTSQRQGSERQFRFDPTIKFMKNDVNHNHVGIKAIDSRRVDQIGTDSAGAPIPPPLPVIGKEPPEIFEQMRPGNVGDFVPDDGIR